jgi:trk system potassium uptake protein TrkA
MGRFGTELAKNMLQLGNDVMIVDEDEDIITSLAERFVDSHIGDCTSEAVLRSLSVDSFDICFVTIGSNFQSSLVITSLLKKLGAKFIVAKAKQDIQAELLHTIGANEVIYPERDIAEKVAVRYNANNIFDYIQLTDNYAIYEIPVPKELVGITIKDADIRRRYNINIIAIKQGNVLNPAPSADRQFETGDILVVIGRSADVFRVASKAE